MNTNTITRKDITLKPRQIAHYNRMYKRFLTNKYCYDFSVMRAGKTYTASKLMYDFGINYSIVTCPLTAEDSWMKMKREFGAPISLTMSYQALATKKDCQPKHGLLYRDDSVKDKPTFHATEYYLELTKVGILLIFDEVSEISNRDTTWWKAAKALIDPIINTACPSRVLLISGFPMRKEEEVISFMRLVSIITEPLMYRFHSDSQYLELRGAKEVADLAGSINPQKTSMVLNETPFLTTPKALAKNITSVCYNLYTEVIQHEIVSTMPGPENNQTLDIQNGYYRMLEDDRERYKAAIASLKRNANYNDKTGEVDLKNGNFGGITKDLVNMTGAMLRTMVRKTIEKLDSDPRAKVVLSVDYTAKGIKILLDNLTKYRPMVLNGSVKKQDRVNILSAFQKHWSQHKQGEFVHRLIISNMKVVAFGITLADEYGDEPRYMYGRPSFYIRNMHQWSRRAYTEDTKSNPTVRFVYGNISERDDGVIEIDKIESNIFNAILKAKAVADKTLEQQIKDGVKFPGDYSAEIEPNGANLNIPFKDDNTIYNEIPIDEDDDPESVLPAIVDPIDRNVNVVAGTNNNSFNSSPVNFVPITPPRMPPRTPSKSTPPTPPKLPPSNIKL